MEIDNPLISVIIPAYNAENTLSKCLDSIFNQSYKNIEIILINDGSIDCTSQLAISFAQKDDRLKVYDQINLGVSNARNNALAKCNGIYMCCLDADDFVTKDYVLNLYRGIQSHKGKGLVIQNLDFSNLNNNGFYKEFEDKVIDQEKFYKIFSQHQIEMYGFNCGKLFDMEIIKKNEIRYNPNISVSEDLVFMLEYICDVDYIHFISGKDYHYTPNPYNILTYKFASFKSESLLFEKYIELIQRLAEKYNMNNEYLDHAYKSGAEMLIRMFYSHYRVNNNMVSRLERESEIKTVLSVRKSFFYKYYNPTNIKERISKFLLINNHIRLFDFYREIIRYTQKRKMKRVC